MTLEYVDDPRRYTGVAYACVSTYRRPKRRNLDAYTDKLVQVMGTREVPFITALEKARLLERLHAAADEQHEIFPEARDGDR